MAYSQGYRPPSRQQSQQQRKAPPRQNSSNGRPAASRKRKQKKRGRPVRIFFTLVLFALVATVGVMGYMMYEEVGRVERLNTFYPGVYVDGVPLYGATPQAAYDYLVSRSRDDLKDWSIELSYGGRSWPITMDTLGMGGAIETVVQEEVNKAFLVGRSGNIVERYTAIMELKTEPYEAYTTGIEKNTARIDSIISEIQAAVYKAPVDATRTFDATRKNNPIVITQEEYGQELDAASLKAQIIGMVNKMEAGTINIEPTVIPPTFTAAALQNEIVLLGSYESPISSSSTHERNLNVERGVSAFHGKVVQPGEKVSFNKWVGERTEKNGFYPAQEIVSGAYEMGIGGGICQVSSALYNAVIQANLRVRSRTNHSIPVNYMEMGADATVSDNRIDFVFENDTGSPIYLIARVDSSSSGKKKTCVFQIYGRPDPNGYTYSLRHETLEEIPIPEPIVEKDRKAEYVVYTDQTHEVSKGAVGHKVKTYLVTKDAHGNFVSEKELYVDTYKAQAPKVYVGVTPR